MTVAGTGNLEMRDLVEVYPVGSGTADSVDVETGDAVKAGDTLYTLDADEAKAATAKAYASYRQAVEGVKRAESTLFKARKTLSELEDLQDEQEDAASKPSTSTVSQNNDEVTDNDIKAAEKDVATAKAGVTSAEAQCSSALLAYEQTKTAQGNLTVTAPVSGIVWAVNVEEGGSVSSGGGSSGASGQNAGTTTSSSSSAPVSIATDGELAVKLAVNEVDIPSLEVDQRADLAFDALADLSLTGTVAEIGTEGTVDQGVVTYDVWIALDVDDDQLASGMSVSATIVTDVARGVLLVPKTAVKSDDDGEYVQVLDPGAAEPRQVAVVTGLEGTSQVVVESGLEEGDAVVTKTTEAADAETDSAGGSRRGSIIPPMPGGR